MDLVMPPVTMSDSSGLTPDTKLIRDTDDSEFPEGIPVCEYPLCAWYNTPHWHPAYWESIQ